MILILTISGYVITFISLCFLMYSLLSERTWQERVNINYNNYTDYSKKFQYKDPRYIKKIYLGIVVLIIVYLYLILPLDRFFIFEYLMLINIVLISLSLWVITSRKSKNIKLDKFNKIHDLIKNINSEKAQLENKRNQFIELRKNFIDQNKKIEENLKKIFEKKSLKLDDTLTSIDKIVDEINKSLNGFDNELINKFNDELKYYIKNKVERNINFSKVNYFSIDPIEVKKEILDIQKRELTNAINDYLENENISELGNLKENLDYFYDFLKIPLSHKSINKIFELMNNEPSLREVIYNYITTKNNLKTSEKLDYIINRKYDWILEFDRLIDLKEEEYIKLSEYLIIEEKSELAIVFLTTLPKEKANFITKVIKNQVKINLVYNYFLSFSKIIKPDNQIKINSSNKYEFMSLAINKYKENYDKSLNAVKSDDLSVTYQLNIIDSYNKINLKHQNLIEIAYKTLFLWLGSKSHDLIFDENKVLTVFNEYIVLFSLKEIEILLLLIISYIFTQDNEEIIKKSTLMILENLINTQKLKITLNKDFNIDKDSILKYLVDSNNRDEMMRVVNRIEKERLLIEKITNYKRNNWIVSVVN